MTTTSYTSCFENIVVLLAGEVFLNARISSDIIIQGIVFRIRLADLSALSLRVNRVRSNPSSNAKDL
jgi:hypothetical protein